MQYLIIIHMSYKVISKQGYSKKDFTSIEEAILEAKRMTVITGLKHGLSKNPDWYDRCCNLHDKSKNLNHNEEPENIWITLKISINLHTLKIENNRQVLYSIEEVKKFWRFYGINYTENMDTSIYNKKICRHEITKGFMYHILIHTKIK